MRHPELISEGTVDVHISRLLKNWVATIIPTRHNRHLLLQRAALIQAARRPAISKRFIFIDSIQAMLAFLFNIFDQPGVIVESRNFEPVAIYRRHLQYNILRIEAQPMVNVGMGLGLFASH